MVPCSTLIDDLHASMFHICFMGSSYGSDIELLDLKVKNSRNTNTPTEPQTTKCKIDGDSSLEGRSLRVFTMQLTILQAFAKRTRDRVSRMKSLTIREGCTVRNRTVSGKS